MIRTLALLPFLLKRTLTSSASVALWDRNRAIILVLAVIALAHWTILWRGMFIVDAVYSPVAKGCIIVSTNHIFLNASFFVSACHFRQSPLRVLMCVVTQRWASTL